MKKSKNIILVDYAFDGAPSTRVSHFKYLGLTITKDIRWKMLINNLCYAAERRLWSLRRKLKLAVSDGKLTD